MAAALFPTFASQGCPGCSGFVADGLPSAALRASSEAWAVVWVIGILAATAILFLAGVASRLAAMVNAVAALVGLGLAIYEGAVAFPGSLPAELVPHVPVFYVLDAGYYLFLGGALVAVGAATLMLLMRSDREGEPTQRALTSQTVASIAGWACLASLAIAGVGAFLPFARLNCGFGCPSFSGPPQALVSGAIVGSADGAIVLALLVAAAFAIALRLAGHGKPMASTIALVVTLAVTILVSFESLHAATRVLGWIVAIPTAPEQGYYLLQAGAAIAAVLAVLLVAADRPSWRIQRPRADTARVAIRPTQ
jgi:hypothetical protein